MRLKHKSCLAQTMVKSKGLDNKNTNVLMKLSLTSFIGFQKTLPMYMVMDPHIPCFFEKPAATLLIPATFCEAHANVLTSLLFACTDDHNMGICIL